MARRSKRQDRQHARSLDELEQQLRRQFAFLARSAQAYDDGDTDEAVRLAATVRVLCHDGSGAALLSQLGNLRKKLRFVDTALTVPPPPAGGSVLDFGLATMRTDFDSRSVKPRPHLDDLPPERLNPPARFGPWWTTPFLTNRGAALFANREGFTYSRSDVVLGLAHHDGGAHVDRTVPHHYQAFIDNDGGIGFNIDGHPVTVSRYALAGTWMRQIAHELQRTLERDFRTAAILEGRPSGLEHAQQ
jgi:hypothetical protein